MLALLAAALVAGEPPSVYELHPLPDAFAIGFSYAASLTLTHYAGELIHPSCPCDPQDVNALDRPAIGLHSLAADRASDITVGAITLVPMVLDLWHLGLTRPLVEDVVVFQEAIAVNTFFVTLVKYIVQRPLPRTYAGDPTLLHTPGGYRSFYSGHTSLAFAALSTAAITAEKRGFPSALAWTIALIVGGSVGVERVLAGRHFWTDVAVGAVAGTAVGFAVTTLHARGNLAVSANEGGASLAFTTRF